MSIRGDFMSAMIKCTKRKHRAHVDLASRLLEQRESLVMIRWSAAAIYEQLAKKNLRVHQPSVGRARYPGAAFDYICEDTAAFDQNAAVPILGRRHALCRTAKPQ